MSKWIDADALMNQWCDEMCKPKPNCEEDCAVYDYVRLAPTIEPKRGEWIVYEGEWKDFDYYPPKCKCNQCGYEEELYILNAKPTNFCPNCGADMREVRDE